MAGIGALFSSALRVLVDGLEAGTAEGVRIEVEKIREDERRQLEARLLRAKVEAEIVMAMDNERKEREKLEEEKKKNDEVIRAERQRERDEKTAFWTTPGLRPLAEPPILDWEDLVRTHIPSDLRYQALFPNDPKKRCRMKDIDSEVAVLHDYTYCASMMRADSETDARRREFYDNLCSDIHKDLEEVQEDYDNTWEKKKEEERFRQWKRDEKTAFWTTPGLRPLAEPPLLDWEDFFRTHIPSDLRYQALFPDDPGKGCRMKDIDGERAVLAEYAYCAAIQRDDRETDSGRRDFYSNLYEDIGEDFEELEKDFYDIWQKAAPLCRFEYIHLDNDGRTTHLEQWVKKGADIFYDQPDNVKEKYSHLVPRDFGENRLATFEFCFVRWKGSVFIDAIIRLLMEEGRDLLIRWPQEVEDKYGHLRRFLPRPPPFEPGTPTSVRSAYATLRPDALSRQLQSLRPEPRRRYSFSDWPLNVASRSIYRHQRRFFTPPSTPFLPGTPTSVHSDRPPRADELSRHLQDLCRTLRRRASF